MMFKKVIAAMELTSRAFVDNEPIPFQYTCDGDDINPPLEIHHVPPATKSLALIVDDPDAPAGPFVHWLIWNIDPKTTSINEDTLPPNAREGQNGFGLREWGGPCPPTGEHHYVFTLYALNNILDLPAGSNRIQLDELIDRHLIDEAKLTGLYSRSK